MQSSTLVAWAENTARLAPSPPHGAPRGWGEPLSRRSGHAILALRAQHHRGERRQGQQHGLGLTVRRLIVGNGAAVIAEVAAAIETGIAVGDLAPAAGSRHADAIALPRHRRHVADDQDRGIAFPSLAPEGEDRIGAIVADPPAEAFGLGGAPAAGGG